jgi:hypothetical protein
MCKVQCRVVDSIKPALAAAAHNRMRRAHAAAAMRQPFGTIEPQIELMFELQSERIQGTPLHLKRLQLRQRMQGGQAGRVRVSLSPHRRQEVLDDPPARRGKAQTERGLQQLAHAAPACRLSSSETGMLFIKNQARGMA